MIRQHIVGPTTAAGEPLLEERLAARFGTLSPSERRVARFFTEHREEVVFAPAWSIARRLATSDATVIRTAKALGYAGLPVLKQELAAALRTSTTPARRLRKSLEQLGDDPASALEFVVALQIEFLEELRRIATPERFGVALDALAGAERVLAFGIGPSAALAEYFALQLARFGRPSLAITATGLRLADALIQMRGGDALVLLAYSRVYHEVRVLLERARALGIPVVLVSDTLGEALGQYVTVTLPARRERAGMVSTHAPTIVVLESLVLALAARDRGRATASLDALNALRAQIVGHRVDAGRADSEAGDPGGPGGH